MSRKIDALIAEHVMGLEILQRDLTNPSHHPENDPAVTLSADIAGTGYRVAKEIPRYSTRINIAWSVVKVMMPEWRFKLLDFQEQPSITWLARFKGRSGAINHIEHEAIEDTAPMAICLAALKAKGVEVD